MGNLIAAILDLIASVSATDRENRWHPVLIAAYVLLAVVAVAVVGLLVTS